MTAKVTAIEPNTDKIKPHDTDTMFWKMKELAHTQQAILSLYKDEKKRHPSMDFEGGLEFFIIQVMSKLEDLTDHFNWLSEQENKEFEQKLKEQNA